VTYIMEAKQEIANKQIKSVTNLAILINIILCASKIIVGWLAGSLSLISDGIHSISDMSTDFMILVGVRLGSKKPDEKHHYGHGRHETLVTASIAIALFFVGIGTVYYAVMDMVKQHIRTAHFPVLIVAALALIIKEIISRVTMKIAIKTHSAALYANSWEQRSDALSSLAVVVGFIAMKFGFNHGDQVVTIIIGVMIMMVGVRVFIGCLDELTESAVDSETSEHVRKIIIAHPAIRGCHDLRSRTVGREVFIDIHILVDPDLNVTVAHKITEELELIFLEKVTRPVNVTVHIEPDIPTLHK
jgi:cation diffusion facilitator family transporter